MRSRLFAVTLAAFALFTAGLACNLGNPAPEATPTPAETATIATTATITPTNGPTQVIKATPSLLPASVTPIPPTVSPVPTAVLTAKVCATCQYLRVRETPGTTGRIITQLATNTPITLIGRTVDGTWLLVVTPDGRTGWGVADFITPNGDINTLSIVNVSVADLPTTTASPPPPSFEPAPSTGDVVTGITSNSRKIFLSGQAKGNLPGVFTRIGDSLTASPAFLNPLLGPHDLGSYGYLSAALSFFSGPNARGANPFQAASLAERNNWTTRDILSPDNVPSEICQAGETTVSCEYRLVRPSVALILIGTNDAAREVSPDEFSANLQRIVHTSIDMGVIPVLSTLPPKHLDDWNTGRVNEFNGIIAGIARINDVPLVNLWLALQTVPNNGIHPDGVHLNSPPDGLNANFDASHLAYGYPMRNLTSLQVLDALRRQVLYGGGNVALPSGNQSSGSNSAPAARPCDGAPLPRLVVGGKAVVTPGLPNKLRAGPHKIDTVIGAIPSGGIANVIGGPVCGDGLRWWQVTYKGLNGWTADGTGAEYWLLPG